MFYHKPSGLYVDEGRPFTVDGTQYPANWLNLSTPEDKTALGLVEVMTVGTREDDKYFWVSEELNGATRTIVSTPKSAEMIAEMERAATLAEIERMERESMIPRAVREYMILDMELKATTAGYTVEQLRASHHAYRKVKEFDEEITKKREKL